MKSLGNFAVIGDSYSTYEKYIPDDYPCYYGRNRFGEELKRDYNMGSVNDTWWKMLEKKTSSTCVYNDSWSGSAFAFSHYDGVIWEEQSIVTRVKKLFDGKEKFDTILVYAATNDNWLGTPLGEIKYENFRLHDFNFVLPSICFALKFLKEHNENTRIVCVINGFLYPELLNAYVRICNDLGLQFVLVHDFKTFNGHPTKEGMQTICDQIHAEL